MIKIKIVEGEIRCYPSDSHVYEYISFSEFENVFESVVKDTSYYKGCKLDILDNSIIRYNEEESILSFTTDEYNEMFGFTLPIEDGKGLHIFTTTLSFTITLYKMVECLIDDYDMMVVKLEWMEL